MMKILSLGAGVQSSTVLLMSCKGELPKLDAAIFADTGWEPEAVYDNLAWLETVASVAGIPLLVVRAGNIKQDALVSQVRGVKSEGHRWASMPYYTQSSDGNAGMIKRQCTAEYKIAPIEKKIRELLGYKKRQRIKPGSCEQWFGISVDEQRRVRVSRKAWVKFYYPLIFGLDKPFSRHDCRLWLKRNYPERDVPRSACIGCPFHSDDEWRSLKNNGEWTDAVDFDKRIRKCGGMRGDMYLHRSRQPLDEIDFSTPEDHGQQDLFCDSGFCFV